MLRRCSVSPLTLSRRRGQSEVVLLALSLRYARAPTGAVISARAIALWRTSCCLERLRQVAGLALDTPDELDKAIDGAIDGIPIGSGCVTPVAVKSGADGSFTWL